jgi:hypothetical protein
MFNQQSQDVKRFPPQTVYHFFLLIIHSRVDLSSKHLKRKDQRRNQYLNHLSLTICSVPNTGNTLTGQGQLQSTAFREENAMQRAYTKDFEVSSNVDALNTLAERPTKKRKTDDSSQLDFSIPCIKTGCQNPDCHVQPPEHFVCPITGKLLTDPVITTFGNTYEREVYLKC